MWNDMNKQGFTLLEMLVVVVIIAILTGLVMGISTYVQNEGARKETESTQAVVMQAIQVYYDISFPNNYPLETEWLRILAENPEACEYLLCLPSDTYRVLQPPNPQELHDGWGRAMNYRRSSGFGGRPVIVSAGPDGKINTEKDNIRSDGR